MGNTILAKGGNHILAKRDNSAWPKGSKLSGFSTYDLFNNEIVLGLLLIVYCLMIYFIYNAFIDRNDKYVSYFKKFRKQGFGKLFICYVISYSVTIACCCLSLSFILTK